MLQRLIIGAPFGNYLQFSQTTPTLGTFTLECRGGWLRRLWRVVRTVRYYPGLKSWKNKLGLPNPGIVSLIREVEAGRITLTNKIVSVAARTTADWLRIFELLAGTVLDSRPSLELNVSCPNCQEADTSDYRAVFEAAVGLRARAAAGSMAGPEHIIIKLPPLSYGKIVDGALTAGIVDFHACNTIPSPGGGMSGKILKPFSLAAVAAIRPRLPAGATLIGGGGITCQQDAFDYLNAGATHVSVASVLFNPFRWPLMRRLAVDIRWYIPPLPS
jgi:dihydroorotate dehydrogenase